MSYNKIARRLFLLVGCVFPIFIGSLHTFTHFSELTTIEIHNYLQKEVVILNAEQTLWNTWGIVSFMMGASFIIIGLLNSTILRMLPKENPLPLLAIVAMIVYQICVTYVGYAFEQNFQFYGGLFGFVVMLLCLIFSLKIKRD